jgi:hypothetical protein
MVIAYSEIIQNLDQLNELFQNKYERFKGGLRVDPENTDGFVAKIILFRNCIRDDNNYNLVFNIQKDGSISSHTTVYKDSYKLKWSTLIQIWLENSVSKTVFN